MIWNPGAATVTVSPQEENSVTDPLSSVAPTESRPSISGAYAAGYVGASLPPFPEEATTTAPPATASTIAARMTGDGSGPPRDRLMTSASCVAAQVMPAAIWES